MSEIGLVDYQIVVKNYLLSFGLFLKVAYSDSWDCLIFAQIASLWIHIIILDLSYQ